MPDKRRLLYCNVGDKSNCDFLCIVVSKWEVLSV